MSRADAFPVDNTWRVLLADLGVRPGDLLRRAGLPEDLLGRENARLDAEDYFRLWEALGVELDDPLFPIRLGKAIRTEAFSPPVFAALCSPDLNTALRRISRYKRLVMPMALHVEVGAQSTSLTFEWLNGICPPASMRAMEIVFFVQLARIATREEIRPLRVTSPVPFEPAAAYEGDLGVRVERGDDLALFFRSEDARRPFLTANEAMWEVFEPRLRERLSELEASATMSERVRAALLELLPSGAASINAVAQRLGLSRRTLQRRLKEEGAGFQRVLNGTREELARHYLAQTRMSGAEISFLLGFEDPNSFFRAFNAWTGTTPERARSVMLAGT